VCEIDHRAPTPNASPASGTPRTRAYEVTTLNPPQYFVGGIFYMSPSLATPSGVE
ncbi:uncharacterized protein METZ01_LOCUS310466, partial [marine metagenome]